MSFLTQLYHNCLLTFLFCVYNVDFELHVSILKFVIRRIFHRHKNWNNGRFYNINNAELPEIVNDLSVIICENI